jgi:site-specific DNA-methyltransferase (adenine-specific)
MLKPYYQDSHVTIYHGDCADVVPSLGPIDHVVTDPPYSAVTHAGALGDGGASALVDFASVNADELIGYVALCAPLVRRWVIATVDWRHILPLEQRTPAGLRFVRFGIWAKPNGAPQFTGDRPATGWEAMAILHSTEGRLRWNGGGRHGVYYYPKLNAPEHPTEKPAGLLMLLLNDFTDPGESILDPFMGSGTTLVAAKRLGRTAVGIEREERYCEIAARRCSQGALSFVERDRCSDGGEVQGAGFFDVTP